MRLYRRWWTAIPLGLILGVCLFAEFFAPYGFAVQHRDRALAPPTGPRWLDAEGRFHLRPFVETAGATYPLRFFVRGDHYRLFGILETDRRFLGVEPPGRLFLLGTDSYGRDVLSRLLYGGRVSLGAGLLGAGLSLGLALLVGSVSGYFGGGTDDVLMRLTDLFLALPRLYLLLAARAFLPLSLSGWQTFFLVVLLLGLVGWPRPARIVRSLALGARRQQFVTAARSFGAGNTYLMLRHVLPQTRGAMMAQAGILIPGFVLAEVTLSFVGLGVAEPLPSWGTMLASLREYHLLISTPWLFAPGVLLTLVTLLFQALLSEQKRERGEVSIA